MTGAGRELAAADPGQNPEFCFPLEHLAVAVAVNDQAVVEISQPFPHASSLSEPVRIALKALENPERRTKEC